MPASRVPLNEGMYPKSHGEAFHAKQKSLGELGLECRNLIKKPWAFIRVPLKGSIRVTIRDL